MSSSSNRWILIALLASGVVGLAFGGCSSKSANNATGATGGTGGGEADGTDGVAGAAGAGGSEAGPSPHVCTLTCAADGDCEVVWNSNQYDVGLTCNQATGSCTSCVSPADCVALLSAWVFPCTTNAACAGFEINGEQLVCISVNGQGRCAVAEGNGCGQAIDAVQGVYAPPDIVSMPLVEGGTLDVCAHQKSADCRSGQCAAKCNGSGPITGNQFCNNYATSASQCDPSGECVCSTSQDCEGSPHGSLCTQNGRCGCETNSDCSGALGKECVGGYCSCSSNDDCVGIKKDGFENLAPTCAAF